MRPSQRIYKLTNRSGVVSSLDRGFDRMGLGDVRGTFRPSTNGKRPQFATPDIARGSTPCLVWTQACCYDLELYWDAIHTVQMLLNFRFALSAGGVVPQCPSIGHWTVCRTGRRVHLQDGFPRCSGKLAHGHRALDCHLHPHAIHPSLSLDFQGRTTSIDQQTAPIYKSTQSFYLVQPIWDPKALIKDG